jgi:hypothetical protein
MTLPPTYMQPPPEIEDEPKDNASPSSIVEMEIVFVSEDEDWGWW